jgi:hypothetical protein
LIGSSSSTFGSQPTTRPAITIDLSPRKDKRGFDLISDALPETTAG